MPRYLFFSSSSSFFMDVRGVGELVPFNCRTTRFFLFFCACLLISSRRKRKKKLGYVKIQILLIGEKGAASCVSCAETPGFLVLLCCQRVFPLYLVKDLSVSFDEIYPELLFTAATIVHRSLSLLSDIYRKGRTDGRNKNDSQIELNK